MSTIPLVETMNLTSIQNLSLTEAPSHSAESPSKNTGPLGSELPSSAKALATDATLLTGIPAGVLQTHILTKLGASDHRTLHAINKHLRANVPLTERSCDGANLKNTIQDVNREHTNTESARNTSTLFLNDSFSLADFKDLPPCPKITKLVLTETFTHTGGVTPEMPLHIAKIFPNLQNIEAQGLNELKGIVISEMLATETLKSLKLENVDKQVDTLSGPLHTISSNHLTELVYSETQNDPRNNGFLGFLVDVQFDKLLETSKNLKAVSLSGHFGLDQPNAAVQARCQKLHAMKALTHFEMKNAPNMAEEYLGYMVSECSNLEHLNLSNNPKGVGTSFQTLLGQRRDDPSKPVLPLLKHLTFWENAAIEPEYVLRGGAYGQQVESSLKLLGRHQERLQQLDLKVGGNVSEGPVIQAIKSVKHGGKLTLGLSQQVTAQTVEKIKDLRPDMHIVIEQTI